MKTTVVCGLLGSGKTTYIRNRLQSSSEKTVVLVNDFGKAGIDGEIFTASGIEAIELPSGCICCTLKFDLITTITKIVKEFSPEHLMIEPSGIASPLGVLEALESAGIKASSVIGIVDVTEFTELYESGMYGNFFEEQIANSDVVLVNKIDLADGEQVGATVARIEHINPRAILFQTVNAAVVHPLLPEARNKGEGEEQGQRVGRGHNKKILFRSPDHFHFETLSFKLMVDTELSRFSDFFEALAGGRYGNVARAKALLMTDQGPYRLDGVYGKVDRARFEQEIKDSRLVVIGERLDKTAIEKTLFGGE